MQARIAADDIRHDFWHSDDGNRMHILAPRQQGEDAPAVRYGFPVPCKRAS